MEAKLVNGVTVVPPTRVYEKPVRTDEGGDGGLDAVAQEEDTENNGMETVE